MRISPIRDIFSRLTTRLRRHRQVLLVAGVFTVVFIGFAAEAVNDARIKKDSLHNFSLAANLLHHGVFSMNETSEDPRALNPSAYREPLLPFVIALHLAHLPAAHGMSKKAMLKNRSLMVALRICQALHLWIIALLTGLLGWTLTRRLWVAAALMFAVGLDGRMLGHINKFCSENLIALFLLVHGLLLVRFHRKPSLLNAALLGLFAGVLPLAKAVFLYYMPIAILVVAWIAFKQIPDKKRWAITAGAFVVLSSLLWGGWMIRNHHHFGRFLIAERGGVVLNIRANIDTMTPDEYRSAFYYYSPANSTLREILAEVCAPLDTARFSRSKKNKTGFYQSARTRREELREELKDNVLADAVHLAEAKQKVIDNFGRHLLATVPIFYRGMFPGKHPPVVYFLLFGNLIVLVVLMVKGRRADALLALMPSLFSLAFYAALTHNIPRYSQPVTPFLWLAAALSTAWVIQQMSAPPPPPVTPGSASPVRTTCRRSHRHRLR